MHTLQPQRSMRLDSIWEEARIDVQQFYSWPLFDDDTSYGLSSHFFPESDEGVAAMFRSLFLALGAYTCLLGVEALALEKAVIKKAVPGKPHQYTEEDLVPPEWAPWSLMGGGAVVVLYTLVLPRRYRS